MNNVSKFNNYIKENTKSVFIQDVVLSHSEMKKHISDLLSKVDRYACSYGAVVSLDLNKIDFNRQNKVHTIVICGDNIKNAIDDFFESEESDGLNREDFNEETMTIQYQATF